MTVPYMSIQIVTRRHGTTRNVVSQSSHNSDAADLHLEDVDDRRERLAVNDLGVVRQTSDDRRLDEVAFPVDHLRNNNAPEQCLGHVRVRKRIIQVQNITTADVANCAVINKYYYATILYKKTATSNQTKHKVESFMNQAGVD